MMGRVLIDSNVLLDIMTEDARWFGSSSEKLSECAEENVLAIDPVIYAEVSIRFERIEELEAALPENLIERLPIPWEAAFLAGKCFRDYRKRGGERTSTLPDFFIGAHAVIEGMSLPTRDTRRYATCFPNLALITPE